MKGIEDVYISLAIGDTPLGRQRPDTFEIVLGRGGGIGNNMGHGAYDSEGKTFLLNKEVNMESNIIDQF